MYAVIVFEESFLNTNVNASADFLVSTNWKAFVLFCITGDMSTAFWILGFVFHDQRVIAKMAPQGMSNMVETEKIAFTRDK